MEAPRGVEPTGTNGRKATLIFPDPFGDRIILLQTTPDGNEHCLATRRNINEFASPIRFPGRHTPVKELLLEPYKRRFAAAMAQERRPVPFRTRKLRPGTAMVLHPTGCGRVARRRTTRTGSPDTPQRYRGFPHIRTLARGGGVYLASLGPGRSIPSGPSAFWAATR